MLTSALRTRPAPHPMHAGVVNRDIKLENTLLQMVPNLPLPLLKICDFGYSKAQFMSAPKSKVGTLACKSVGLGAPCA